VVIDNGLVMVDLCNEYLAAGHGTRHAVREGTEDRFRPILPTSVTTFLGVYPLIMETSLQAQLLIPLAVSIGYGVLVRHRHHRARARGAGAVRRAGEAVPELRRRRRRRASDARRRRPARLDGNETG